MSNKFTPKRKESNKRYKSKLARLDIWVTPEEKEIIKKRAADEKKSVNSYIRGLIGLKDTPMQKDEI